MILFATEAGFARDVLEKELNRLLVYLDFVFVITSNALSCYSQFVIQLFIVPIYSM